MNFKEIKEIVKSQAYALNLIHDKIVLETATAERIIEDLLSIETALFRARIKIERTINQK